MTPSIYDYRNGEIENARRIRRERVRNVIGAIVIFLGVIMFKNANEL